MARPTSYKPEYAEQVLKLCRLGLTDKEIAKFFEVAESTLNLWKKKHSEFSESLKSGKVISDAEVADKLLSRALGYTHNDVDIRVVSGEIVQTPIMKHYPPDTSAAIFWLKNRQPSKWREKPLDDGEEEATPLTINFSVQEAKGDIKVTRGSS